MKVYWPLTGVICLTISGLIISTLLILSLIPLYISSSDWSISTTDKTQPFQFASSFSGTAKRSIPTGIDRVDISSFPELQHFLRNVLTTWTVLPRSVTINIEEAYINHARATLYIGGNYRFSLFCRELCQNHILNLPFQIENVTHTLNDLSIPTLNESIHINIDKITNNLQLLNLSRVFELETSVDFNYAMQQKSRRRRRQITENNDNESLYDLIRQTLRFTSNSRNVPFTITNRTFNSTNDPAQLSLSVKLRYPFYCSQDCLEGNIGELVTVLANNSIVNELSYKSNNTLYQIISLKVLSADDYNPESLRTLSYEVDENVIDTSKISPGPITDEKSLKNISDAMHESLHSTEFEVESASFIPESSIAVRSINLSKRQRFRRRSYKRYKLLIIIRFIFASYCNRKCQKEHLKPITDDVYIPRPPPIVITGFIFILPEPLIDTFHKPSSIVIPITRRTTTTTTTTMTTTDAPGTVLFDS